MTKVITYGTYDLLHHGHIRLLERAKALGDYLIVGVTSEDFDRSRGKINVQQPLEARIAALRETGIADKIIIEEYEGQKIDDIKKFGVDIFTVGSDWVGKFDYLNEYCDVVYLERTEGVSSTEIRSSSEIKVGLVGYAPYLDRVLHETSFVNGIKVTSLCAQDTSLLAPEFLELPHVTNDYEEFLKTVDAVYIHSRPDRHYDEVREALLAGKHVMCESPIAESKDDAAELMEYARSHNLVLMDSLRTAYSMAYQRMLLLVKGGRIGDVVSVDATCTSLSSNKGIESDDFKWGSMETWGPTALLPVFQILGTDYEALSIVSRCKKDTPRFDDFTELILRYDNAMATCKVGAGVKSEGSLVVSGTKGYVYVPAPWWKTEYFELRYEDPANNRRYFYQLDGEGIRYEWVAFAKMISAANTKAAHGDMPQAYLGDISTEVTFATCGAMDDFLNHKIVMYASTMYGISRSLKRVSGEHMKTVMILGGSASEVPVIEASLGMGHRTIVVDYSDDVPGFHVDGVIVEHGSIADVEAILALAKKYAIDGIIASADAGVLSAARVATELGLPGITEETAFMGTNKVAMRKRLKECGVPIPEFFVVADKQEYLDVVRSFKDKAIVKAVDSAGSRGIYLLSDLSNDAEIEYAYDYCLPFSGTGELLVEEVMEGPEICAETLSSDGKCYCVQITDQLAKTPPFFTDCGYNQPSVLPLETVERIRQIAEDANMALGNYQGSSCTEMIITEDGPKVVELGVRLAGDYMATQLPLLSNGVDMAHEVVHVALGEPIDVEPKQNKCSASRYFMEERVGTIKEITGFEEAWAVPHVVKVEALKGIGDQAVPLRKSSDRLGLVLTQADTVEEAIKAAEEAVSKIDFVVE